MRLFRKSVMPWKYEFIATHGSQADFAVLSSSKFKAADLAEAKSILANVVTDIEAQGSVSPNAIRLIDPSGQEIWRALIAGPRPAARRVVHQIYSGHHHRPLAQKKWRHF
jgi:hypothetical protein